MKSYLAISVIIFLVVAVVHLVRLALGWQVQVGPNDVPMSVSWIGLLVSAILTVWGVVLLRRGSP